MMEKVIIVGTVIGFFGCKSVKGDESSTQLSVESDQSTFFIQLDVAGCAEESTYKSEFLEEVDSLKDTRTISANNIPNHSTGQFPNSGNPNSISPQSQSYTVDLSPKKNDQFMNAQGYSFGVLLNGVEVDPFTNEFFQGKRGANREWNINALTSSVNLGTDCNNAHVQPGGKYHYHGTPNAFLEEMKVDGSSMVKIGYAADGFPIYYKYGYNNEGELIELTSGYQLKSGKREGDGANSPDGAYDGTYFQDYEFKSEVSLLDQCNGRTGRTPENESEYYYVITDNFPSSPLCFSGTPSTDFRHGGGNMGGNGRPSGNGEHNSRPDPSQLMAHMDENNDGQLSNEEVQGPLKDHFDQLDTDKNGFLSLEELKNGQPVHPHRH